MNRAPEDAYWAAGYMGQRTMVIPSRDMVIVRLGPSLSGFGQYFNTFVGEVLDAASEQGAVSRGPALPLSAVLGAAVSINSPIWMSIHMY